METPETPLKEKNGLKSAWIVFKDIFKPKPASAQSCTIGMPTTLLPVVPVPLERGEEKEEATFTPQLDHPQPPTVPAVNNTIATLAQEVEPFPKQQTDSSVTAEDSQLEPQMRSNRVEAIFARYNLELDETEWDRRPKFPHERVHKNIRLRVRYTCHNCSTTFGRDRVCIGCQHRRCTRCSRYPPKKDRPKTIQDAADDASPPPQTDASRPAADGGTCHECQTGIEIDVEECPNCHHRICERCIHQASITVEPAHDPPPQSTRATASEKDPEQRTTSQEESTTVS